jgi:hypothetical protein
MAVLARIAASVACATALGACTTTDYSVTPTTDAGGIVSYERGIATVASEQEHTAVKVTPLGFTPRGRIRLGIAALNKGAAPLNLGYENVDVVDVSGIALHKLDKAELVRIAKRQAEWAEVAVALAGAAAAYGNSQSAYSTTYGNVGGTTFSARTYNPGLANALNDQNAEQTGRSLRDIDAGLGQVIANLNGSILETTTIAPGQSFGGEIIVDPPKALHGAKVAQPISVRVTLGGEVHAFKFLIAAKEPS